MVRAEAWGWPFYDWPSVIPGIQVDLILSASSLRHTVNKQHG
jgi:hypothetical protein